MDRRTLLAAALVAPVAVAAPTALAATSTEFERALAEYRSARRSFNNPIPDDVSMAACERLDATFEILLRTPSRHAGDLATKIEILIAEYDESIIDEDRLRLVALDARALSGGAS